MIISQFVLVCLAASSGKYESHGIKIISRNKNGGREQVFSVVDPLNDPNQGSINNTRKRWQTTNLPTVVNALQSALRSTFLPVGFPMKTPPGYLKYSFWSWCQDLSTQLRSVLATQRVLEGVGVGREGATALSALISFIVRDGCGMAATLLFTSAASSRFRTDVKRWRLFADIMVDIGITLEVMSTASFVPGSFFLPMISLGTCCKAICGVAAGATGGRINLHWARNGDISDINAKFGAQHTVTGAIGLVVSAAFAKSVSNVNAARMFILYSLLTFLHVFANMQCMRLLAFNSLNESRMDLILREFFHHWEKLWNPENPTSTIANKDIPISNPFEVAKKEPLFFGIWAREKKLIFFGDSYDAFSTRKSSRYLSEDDGWIQSSALTLASATGDTTGANSNENYLISSGLTKERWGNRGRPCVTVVFGENSSPTNEAKAFLHARILARKLSEIKVLDSENFAKEQGMKMDDAEAKARAELDASWAKFQSSCSNHGWDLSKTELQTLGYEVMIS